MVAAHTSHRVGIGQEKTQREKVVTWLCSHHPLVIKTTGVSGSSRFIENKDTKLQKKVPKLTTIYLRLDAIFFIKNFH